MVVVVVVVIYHSHTATEAYPSRPIQFASKRNAQYVVISTRDPPKCELRSCRIVDDWVAEEPVRVAMGCHNSINACGSPHEYCLAGHSAIPASCVPLNGGENRAEAAGGHTRRRDRGPGAENQAAWLSFLCGCEGRDWLTHGAEAAICAASCSAEGA